MSLVVWLWFSWPLPAHMRSGIPFTAIQRPPAPSVVPIQPCDQLQFLYQLWLASDMLAGKTPLFYNLYEFNAGDDAARYLPDAYYAPFSVIYAVCAWAGGRALGINLTGFVTLWLTFWLTWRLVRRYVAGDWLAAVAALPAILLPYRWHALLGGSPTGMAMMLVPMLLLGLDLAVRNDRMRGGLLAGLAILFAGFTDTHTFFFAALTAPAWCAIALLNRPDFAWRRPRAWWRLMAALSPCVLLFGLSAGLSVMTHARLAASLNAGGRKWVETAVYAPHWQGLFSWASIPMSEQIYIGALLPALALLGLGALLLKTRRQPSAERWRSLATLILLTVGAAGVIMLALGVNGPIHGAPFKVARLVIPHYDSIRQPAKTFCLLPTLLCLVSVLSLSALYNASEVLAHAGGRRVLRSEAGASPLRRVASAATPRAPGSCHAPLPRGLGTLCLLITKALPRRGWRLALLLALTCLMAADFRARLAAGVFPLDPDQGAYRTVAEDAARRGVPPRAMVVVLWPGDSHETSLCQYYASLHRIRMVNGYSPTVMRDYYENIFRRFASINQGFLANDQLDELTQRGIDYILVHEDRFPEKVSAFPVGFTLKNLLNNPRLRVLSRAHAVWAFRILDKPEARATVGADWSVHFPARRWQAESCNPRQAQTIRDASAAGGACLRMDADGAALTSVTNDIAPAPQTRFMVRVRGHGNLLPRATSGGAGEPGPPLTVQSPSWTWAAVSVPPSEIYRPVTLELKLQSGAIDADMIMLVAGDWNWEPAPGQTQSLPAPCFFRAGHIDPLANTVVLEAGQRAGMVFYGPHLPLTEGRYRLELVYRTPAPAGMELGMLVVNYNDERDLASAPVLAGQPAVLMWTNTDTLPINLQLVNHSRADLILDRVTITRVE